MDTNRVREAIAAGEFNVIMEYINPWAGEALDVTLPCGCGHSNRMMIARLGVTIVMWTDAERNHGATEDNGFSVLVHRSEAEAIECFGELRKETEQTLGMIQLATAVAGGVPAPGGMVV